MGMIYLDVVNPTEILLARMPVNDPENNLTKYNLSRDTNLYSVAYRLSFKNFPALFSGDIPPEISESFAANWTIGIPDYIKIPHRGSINRITENLLKATMTKDLPAGGQIAVISLGKNPWGFPRPEILAILSRYNIEILKTDQMEDIEVVRWREILAKIKNIAGYTLRL